MAPHFFFGSIDRQTHCQAKTKAFSSADHNMIVLLQRDADNLRSSILVAYLILTYACPRKIIQPNKERGIYRITKRFFKKS